MNRNEILNNILENVGGCRLGDDAARNDILSCIEENTRSSGGIIPVQDVDVVTLDGTNWIEHHSVLTRSPVMDNGSGIMNVRYSLAVDGEISGDVVGGKLETWLGLTGLNFTVDQYALCDKMLISGFTTEGGGVGDDYKINPTFQQTNKIQFVTESKTDGKIRGRVMIEIEFTLPNDDYGLGVLS